MLSTFIAMATKYDSFVMKTWTHENIFHERKIFKRLKSSQHPPHYYHNTAVHILFMLPKIREIILLTEWENEPIKHLKSTFNSLNLYNSIKSIKCHNFWDLIGYPSKGYPGSSSTFSKVLRRLPNKITNYCTQWVSSSNMPKHYIFVATKIITKQLDIYNPRNNGLYFDIKPFISNKNDPLLKDICIKNKFIMNDIICYWMQHSDDMLNKLKDCYGIIAKYMGFEMDKLYYELVSVVMASGSKWSKLYWAFIKDLKHECCTNNEFNHWYQFCKTPTNVIPVHETIIEENLRATNFKTGVPQFVVYRRLNSLFI
eukprot:335934_1